MLGLSHSLLFPRLRWIKEAKIKDKDVQLFELDWDHFPRFFENQQLVPFEYDYLTKHTFAISPNYLSEIHEQSQFAMMAWSKRRPFDTMIREKCLEPAVKAVAVAMTMIGDCCYDHETRYYSRDPERRLLTKYALLHKFWANQTGRGMVQEFSEFDKLRGSVIMDDTIKNFLKACGKLQEEWEDQEAALRKANSTAPITGKEPANEPVIGYNYPASECFLKDGKAFVRLERSMFEFDGAEYLTYNPDGPHGVAKKYGTQCRLLRPDEKRPENLREYAEVNIIDGPLKGYKGYFKYANDKAGKPCESFFSNDWKFTSAQVVYDENKENCYVEVDLPEDELHLDLNSEKVRSGKIRVTLDPPGVGRQSGKALPKSGWTRVRVWEGEFEGYTGGFIKIPMVKNNQETTK